MTSGTASPRFPPLRAGFIGGGFMAGVHAQAARVAGAEVAGVASSSPQSADRARDLLGAAQAYPSIEALLAEGNIDVIHVCSPNVTHAPIAGAALEAGKHVICEKPLATAVESALELVELARDKQLVAAVPFVYRFHPMVREARAKVLAGTVGEVITVQGSYLQDWLLSRSDDDWRVDEAVGGPSRAFADIGSHLCDLVEFTLADRIVRLSSRTRTVFPHRANNRDITTEDLAAVIFETRRGTLGTLLVSQLAPGRKNRLALEINGDQQSLFFDQETPESLWVGERSGSRILTRSPEDLSSDAARLCRVPAGHPQGYQDAFNGFVADVYSAISGATPEGLPDFTDGLRAAEVTAAVLESAGTQGWVEVESYAGTPAVLPAPAAGGQGRVLVNNFNLAKD